MKIKFWGVRGSMAGGLSGEELEKKIAKVLQLATPQDVLSAENIRAFLDNLPFSLRSTYGSNTTCVELRTDNDEIIVIDGGSGLRPLGDELLEEERFKKGKGDIDFFFTHTHWDHVIGLQMFPPFFVLGNKFQMRSGMPQLEKRLRYQHVKTHWPVVIEEFPAQITFHPFKEEEELAIKGLRVTAKAMPHPGGCFAYKFRQNDGKTFIMATDVEFNVDTMERSLRYMDFLRGTDVLVFDSQYTFEEALQKIDWGHSSAAIAVEIALKAEVKKLVLFHHDPSYNDYQIDAVTLQALKYKEVLAPNSPLQVTTAYEGMEIEL